MNTNVRHPSATIPVQTLRELVEKLAQSGDISNDAKNILLYQIETVRIEIAMIP